VSDWPRTVFLDPGSDEPVYLKIAHALMAEIHRGRFAPGDSLPGYLKLSAHLGVSRNTVIAAFRELQAEGWVTSTPGEGSRVARRPPSRLPVALRDGPAAAPAPAAGFDMGSAPEPTAAAAAKLLAVASGVPDPKLLPGAALARAYRRALARPPAAVAGDVGAQGHPRLRQALAAMLSGTRGIPAHPDGVLVTRGSQMALFLAGQALFSPGDAVAVESLGAREAWTAFARAGARCLPVGVDRNGLRTAELEAHLARERIRAVLVTPQRQYPTLAVLSPERRARLLELAATHRLAVLEVDQDSEFQFEGRPQAPLAALDRASVVVHVGTLSKIFSPDVRLGFVHGPAPLIRRMVELRLVFDRHGDLVLERAMAELMEDGELQRHLNRMQQVYVRRRDVLCSALRRELVGSVALVEPPGGLALWVNVQDGIDVDTWAARALERGVAFQPGRQFAFDGRPVAGLRMGFSNYPEEQLLEVARRMAASLEGRG